MQIKGVLWWCSVALPYSSDIHRGKIKNRRVTIVAAQAFSPYCESNSITLDQIISHNTTQQHLSSDPLIPSNPTTHRSSCRFADDDIIRVVLSQTLERSLQSHRPWCTPYMNFKTPEKCSCTISVHFTPTQKKPDQRVVLFSCVDHVRKKKICHV